MCLPEESRHSLTPDRSFCCILNRMWQVSGDHGAINPPKAIQEILEYMDIGFTLWESADRYGSAEDCIGEFSPQWEVVRGHRTLFQVLKESATKYQVSIAAVAVYSSLEQLSVAGAIVNTCLGIAENLKDNAKVFDFI